MSDTDIINTAQQDFNCISKKRRILSLVLYIVITAVLTQIDQITKYIAEQRLYNKPDFVIIKDVLHLTYLRNNGSAFGMFSGKINAFLVLTVIMICLITYVVLKMPLIIKYIPVYITCILLAAGAIGNFIDRVRFGYVRDFIYFKITCIVDTAVAVKLFFYNRMIYNIYKYKKEQACGGTEQGSHCGTGSTPACGYFGIRMSAYE